MMSKLFNDEINIKSKKFKKCWIIFIVNEKLKDDNLKINYLIYKFEILLRVT